MKRLWLVLALITFAWPIDAQEVTVPLIPEYYVYSDTSSIHYVNRCIVKDSMGAEIKPFASISFALPKQPMTELDGEYRISSDVMYHDSIGVWMSVPEGYTVTVATSWSTNDHWAVGIFPGPLPYALYWSPFHSSPNVDRDYGGMIYATVEVEQSRGHFARYYTASIDAACFKYWQGSLEVVTPTDATTEQATWYSFPLVEQVKINGCPFHGSVSEATKTLTPGAYISSKGYKLLIARP